MNENAWILHVKETLHEQRDIMDCDLYANLIYGVKLIFVPLAYLVAAV